MEAYIHNRMHRVLEIFKTYGIKNQTMDSIASTLGVSKRTLYKYVGNKDEVVKLALDCELEIAVRESFEILEKFYSQGRNSIELSCEVILKLLNDVLKSSDVFTRDLDMFYYEEKLRLLKESKDNALKVMKQYIELGIKEGYFREDLNYDMISMLLLSSLHSVNYDENLFTKDQIREMNFKKMFLRYSLSSCLTDKGREEFERYYSNL